VGVCKADDRRGALGEVARYPAERWREA